MFGRGKKVGQVEDRLDALNSVLYDIESEVESLESSLKQILRDDTDEREREENEKKESVSFVTLAEEINDEVVSAFKVLDTLKSINKRIEL